VSICGNKGVAAIALETAQSLFRMLAYLSGSIEYSPDYGKLWRADITPFVRELGHEVYDPALDEKKNLEDSEVREFRKWKATDLPRFQETVRKIITWDLDWIEHKSDYVICFWDDAAARGAGTQGELTYAHRLGIPVYLVLGMPQEKVSGWILGCATEVFGSFNELKRFLISKYEPEKFQVATASAESFELKTDNRKHADS
jgi:nucleoside 2-deoxyribosyltransferase